MSSIVKYKDLIAIHPGYYINQVVQDMGITQAEFAMRMGTTAKTLSTLISGQISISNDIAKKLSVMLGMSVEIWLNLQKGYDEKLIEIEKIRDMDTQVDIVKQIDYSYFEAVAQLPKTKNTPEIISNLCRYFAVSNLNILLQKDFLVSYKTGVNSFDTRNVINSKAWIQTAINISKNVKTKPFSAEKLRGYLPELRSMTVVKPEVFLPRMRRILADCGVAFVLLPHLKNSGVDGAVKWISNNRVILAMNGRVFCADKFWFLLFHEIRHVLQQKITKVFINGMEEDLAEYNQTLEDDADNFAYTYLIPPAAMKRFAPNRNTSDADIVAFAEAIGIHPGIVAGRLLSQNIISKSRYSRLIEKYEISASA